MRRRPPWYLTFFPALVSIAVGLPIAYLAVRASEVDAAMLREILLRERNLLLVRNTLGLMLGVIAGSSLLAVPLAWLATSTNIRGRGIVTLLSVLPLAIPGYVLGYSLLALGSPYGPVQELFGVTPFARATGFWGSLVALTLYNFPFLFLTLRTGFLEIDPALGESARALGLSPFAAFRRVTLPQLWPAFASGALLVGLYVLGDFGVVSLMRFETFSYAIYLQYAASLDRAYAAWLALGLLALTITILAIEFRVAGRILLERAGKGSRRERKLFRLGRWAWPAYTFVGTALLFSLALPIGSILFWTSRVRDFSFSDLLPSLFDSLSVSIPVALVATALALPVALLAGRFPSGLSRGFERGAYLGYAIPPLALALGFIFLTLKSVPFLYQSLALLVAALSVHFLALALSPIRSAVRTASRSLEEASRALGRGRWETFRSVSLPLLWPGVAGAGLLVFLSAMKELPVSFLLAPLDFQSLPLRVYGYTTEAMFAEAAPYALAILMLSSLGATLVLRVSPGGAR